MVTRLETGEEIAYLLGVNDDVEKYFPCSRAEWVQWLVSQAHNPGIGIWVGYDDYKDIESYIVCVNTIAPPLSHEIFILYAWSRMGVDRNQEAFGEVIEWAQAIGATGIRAEALGDGQKQVMEGYGFKQVGIMMEMGI